MANRLLGIIMAIRYLYPGLHTKTKTKLVGVKQLT